MARAFALHSGISTKNPGRFLCQSYLPVPVGKIAGEFTICKRQVDLDVSPGKKAGEVRVGRC